MNKFLMAIVFSCVLFSCDIRKNNSTSDVQAGDPSAQVIKDSTTVQVLDSVYNFGKVTDGEKVEYSFRFLNKGKSPLIISSASPSCGCTVAEKPEKPVMPGETGFIKVVFNSKDRVGNAHKDVVVRSNASPGFPVLTIQGEVLAAKK
jgi:hypothetical protein